MGQEDKDNGQHNFQPVLEDMGRRRLVVTELYRLGIGEKWIANKFEDYKVSREAVLEDLVEAILLVPGRDVKNCYTQCLHAYGLLAYQEAEEGYKGLPEAEQMLLLAILSNFLEDDRYQLACELLVAGYLLGSSMQSPPANSLTNTVWHNFILAASGRHNEFSCVITNRDEAVKVIAYILQKIDKEIHEDPSFLGELRQQEEDDNTDEMVEEARDALPENVKDMFQSTTIEE